MTIETLRDILERAVGPHPDDVAAEIARAGAAGEYDDEVPVLGYGNWTECWPNKVVPPGKYRRVWCKVHKTHHYVWAYEPPCDNSHDSWTYDPA